MKLFLTSAGIASEIAPDFLRLADKKPQDMKMVFIPTAANPELDRWYLDKDKINLSQLGIVSIDEVDIEKERKESLSKKINNADIIYVEGGNTFYLLKYVRACGFNDLVNQFLERGGIYVGVSAGSIIAGLNIETAGWKHADNNIVGLHDLTSMGLVPFAITPHYCAEVSDAIKEAAAKISYPVVALTDSQAVIVNGNLTKIIGPGEKTIFNNCIGL